LYFVLEPTRKEEAGTYTVILTTVEAFEQASITFAYSPYHKQNCAELQRYSSKRERSRSIGVAFPHWRQLLGSKELNAEFAAFCSGPASKTGLHC